MFAICLKKMAHFIAFLARKLHNKTGGWNESTITSLKLDFLRYSMGTFLLLIGFIHFILQSTLLIISLLGCYKISHLLKHCFLRLHLMIIFDCLGVEYIHTYVTMWIINCLHEAFLVSFLGISYNIKVIYVSSLFHLVFTLPDMPSLMNSHFPFVDLPLPLHLMAFFWSLFKMIPHVHNLHLLLPLPPQPPTLIIVACVMKTHNMWVVLMT